MLAILRKEINTFFASAVGYLVIAIFLVLNSLFLWVFKGQFNILDSGFANLSPFFQIAPWILLFIIPAVTMRSLSEEKKQGTLELLLTKPLKNINLILGKYLGSLILIIIAILPSLLYILTIYQLGATTGNLDIGSTTGSYIGLLLLSAAYIAIGIFASSITQNQIVSFLIAVLLCFLFYFGFSGFADYNLLGDMDYTIEQLGMQLHYDRISRGVVDTRDVFYFLSIILLFIVFTIIIINKGTKGQKIKQTVFTLIAMLIFNLIGNAMYHRFDLTQDQRFTLSEVTKNVIIEAEAPIVIEILLEGDFPSEFKRLQTETKQLLDEFTAVNPNIQYIFTNPLEEEVLRKETLAELQRFGLTPMEVTVQENGKTEIETIVPWAIMNTNKRSVKIPLIRNIAGITPEERTQKAIQQLEYTFTDGLSRLLHPKKSKIAVLKGNGQLPDLKIADFVKTLQDYYFVGAYTLDSVAADPKKTLEGLQKFDMIINAKPTEAFTEKEKYVLDQFVMNGGKSLWLMESVAMELDSLFTPKESTVAFYRDLRLGDALFSYGVRINPVLINDLYSAPLKLNIGESSNTYQWYYGSLAESKQNHPIVQNIGPVKFEFSNKIDTLKNGIHKTILLSSSKRSKLEGVPKEMRIDNILKQQPDANAYTAKGQYPMAVLLEGEFKSAYQARIKPFAYSEDKDQSPPNKMVVIADGDVIKNYSKNRQPLPLGFDPNLNKTFGNKKFLLNTINYLLEDESLVSLRNKDVNIPFLNIEKVVANRTLWQVVNIIVPILILTIFGFLFTIIRKRKYKKQHFK